MRVWVMLLGKLHTSFADLHNVLRHGYPVAVQWHNPRCSLAYPPAHAHNQSQAMRVQRVACLISCVAGAEAGCCAGRLLPHFIQAGQESPSRSAIVLSELPLPNQSTLQILLETLHRWAARQQG